MFTDYQSQVLLTYHKRKADHQLSPNLLHSTPAKLRAECVAVFNERYRQKDEEILKIFFGSQENEAAYMRTIRKFEADKFKPLDNYLKGNTAETDEKNIELLAWLIDFNARPYRWDFSYRFADTDGKHTADPEQNEPEQVPVTPVPLNFAEQPKGIQMFGVYETDDVQPIFEANKLHAKTIPVPKLRNAIILLLMMTIAGGGVYMVINPTGQEKCMYWTGDHYQSVSCNQKAGDVPVYALDTLRLTHFRKITTPDTITRKSLGSVWYSKIDNVVEFYTADGFHPMHTERKLKPLTDYIWEKYIVGKKTILSASRH